MWGRFRSQWGHRKVLGEEHLLHSEWNRRLGAFSLAGIGGILSLSTVMFLILPRVFAEGSVAPPVPAVVLGLTVQFFVARQLSMIARILPRNSLLYELAFATHSESLAFLLGWSQLVDGLAFVAVMGHLLCDHVKVLFNSAAQTYLRTTAVRFELDRLDFLTPVAIACAATIMCCSLRVLGTITIVFLVTALFTVTSTTVVAVLHNIQQMRVTSLGFPYQFEQVSHEVQWLLLGVFCLEAFSHLSEETEQPRKTLPRMFPLVAKGMALVTMIAVLAYFPFTQKLFFHDRVLLPNVFAAISVFSARYLMSVGAVCALTGALLSTLLPVSRVLCSLIRDRVLFLPASVLKLYGKGGAPRGAVLTSAVLASLLSLLPPDWLTALMTIDICLRIFCQSLLMFQLCFAPEKVGLVRAASKYTRLRANLGTNIDDEASIAADGYSVISSEEHDADDEIISHLCEMYSKQQHSDWSSVTDDHGYQNYHEAGEHSCFQTSCGDDQISASIDGKVRGHHYHIYEADFENSPFRCQRSNGQAPEPFSNPEVGQRLSAKYLIAFTTFGILAAVAHKTLREAHDFWPLLAVGVLAVALAGLLVLLVLTHRLRSLSEDQQTAKSLPLLSLVLVFLTTQLLFTFQLTHFIFLFANLLIGLFVYSLSVLCRLC